MSNELVILSMQREELELALGWALIEGWNVGLHDAECFYNTDPDGFIVGMLGDEPVGCISAVSYESHFGFLGLFIVRPDMRKRGYGKKLWKAAMTRMTGRVVGLDAVPDNVELYSKLGFKSAYSTICHYGHAKHIDTLAPEIKRISKIPFEKICTYDRKYFPAERMKFLDSLVRIPCTQGYAYVVDNEILGYGMIRPCHNGWKIGPLFASNPTIAENLFDALQSSVPEKTNFYIYSTEANPEGMELAQRHFMQPIFETLRMYNGDEPKVDNSGIYSVSSLEVG